MACAKECEELSIQAAAGTDDGDTQKLYCLATALRAECLTGAALKGQGAEAAEAGVGQITTADDVGEPVRRAAHQVGLVERQSPRPTMPPEGRECTVSFGGHVLLEECERFRMECLDVEKTVRFHFDRNLLPRWPPARPPARAPRSTRCRQQTSRCTAGTVASARSSTRSSASMRHC
jgi:hypothetical protein